MSNFKIASRDNNYIIECVHCNGTGFCKNYVSLYKTEIKTLDNSCIWLEFVFNFFYYCKKCGESPSIMESLIRVFDFTNNRIYANLFCNSDKFFNMVKSDFEKYLSCSSKSQSKLTLHSRFDSSEKPQNLICDVCLGKGYNIV